VNDEALAALAVAFIGGAISVALLILCTQS
jgi:hypothetical protein